MFGFFAPTISSEFFPADDAISGLIKTFSVFAAGYLVRPLGGMIFGRIGDRLGRRRALQISIVAMAIPTTLIAFLPTHAQVGLLAPALLVALRLAQGSRRVLATAAIATALVVYPLFRWIDTGALIGVIVAQIVFAVINSAVQGPMPAAMVELFPTRIRYSAMAVGYNVTLAIFGGTAPLIAIWLIHMTGRLEAPAWYLIVIALITWAVTITIKPRPDVQPTSP